MQADMASLSSAFADHIVFQARVAAQAVDCSSFDRIIFSSVR